MQVRITVFGLTKRILTIDEAIEMARDYFGDGYDFVEYLEKFNDEFKSAGVKAIVEYT